MLPEWKKYNGIPEYAEIPVPKMIPIGIAARKFRIIKKIPFRNPILLAIIPYNQSQFVPINIALKMLADF